MRISKHRQTCTGVFIAAIACVTGAGTFANAADASSADSIVNIVAEINASGRISIEQPEALTARLSFKRHDTVAAVPDENRVEETSARKTASSIRAGYRIQIFDDNNPRTARSSAAAYRSRIENTFPAYRAYVSFNSPYWRVKVGDFRSRSEAESAMAEIRRAYPELKAYIRIVRDRINIYD